MALSKTQIDKLGERLKTDQLTEIDLRLLDEYRRSYSDAYEIVESRIRQELGLERSGRPEKSTPSIAEKLRRESIRLSQIQDIAGCRLIVSDILEQDRIVGLLSELFEKTRVFDRREKPSNGYRAVHVVVTCQAHIIEIQVRTEPQQLWAELCEKLADTFDPAIKYGGGPNPARQLLFELTVGTVKLELFDRVIEHALLLTTSDEVLPDDFKENLKEATQRRDAEKATLVERYRDAINGISKLGSS